MHRHGDARIRLGDVDEIQSELPIVRVTGSAGRDILQCHGRKDEVDVSRNDELDATRVDCQIVPALVYDGDRERGGQIGGDL